MDEKSPILPTPAVSNCRCQRENKKSRVFKRILLTLAAVFAFHIFVKPIMINSSHWFHSSPSSGSNCSDRADIPWEGKSHYTVDPAEFSGLSVGQNGTAVGFVKVYKDSDDDVAHIDFDITFSDQYLQDEIFIDTTEEDQSYNFVVRTPRHLHHECIIVKITISLPTSREFDTVKIETVNSRIDFLDAISTKEAIKVATVNGPIHTEHLKSGSVEIATVNGSIHIEKVEADTVSLVTVNRDIKANVKAQSIKADTVNGSINLNTEGPVSNIKTTTVNGATYVKAPQQFDGKFSLRAMMGSTRVTAITNPDKLHFEKKSSRLTEGFYGTGETDAYIKSESTLGTITLEFE
ncbi:hypothetical protein Unana1_04312 [Umbelopsis nana]